MAKTKLCKVGDLGIDIPCGKRARHHLKIVSKTIGDKSKIKYPICNDHYKMLSEQQVVTDLIPIEGEDEEGSISKKFTAVLVKNRL